MPTRRPPVPPPTPSETSTPSFPRRLDAAKRASFGNTLLRAARLFNERAVAELQRTHPEVRATHLGVMPHLDLEGTRLTVLAERAGVTKQAMGQLVDELEALGYLERRPDPSDKRARLVVLTEKGREGMLVGLRVLGAIEGEARAALGEERMDRLHADLGEALAALERGGRG